MELRWFTREMVGITISGCTVHNSYFAYIYEVVYSILCPLPELSCVNVFINMQTLANKV